MGLPSILHLYVSAGHNYFGRHGRGSDHHATEERTEVRCVAGRGIEGDRFFEYKNDYRGQITFFADEIYQQLREKLAIWDRSPAVFRRNVITRGIDLASLYGQEFEIQGIRFLGTVECKPCYWMDEAFGPGAEAALRGRGGLRAKILTDGRLAAGEISDFRVQPSLQPSLF